MYKNLRILDYQEVLNEINRITKDKRFIKQKSFKTKLDNIEVPYYTLGTGSSHIVIVGGIHGSEIISVDFVLRLMENISNGEEVFQDIFLDKDEFTFHFIPVLNIEGYIVSTSAIRTKLKRDDSEEKIESLSKQYFLAYKKDDINSKNNPSDKSQKLHQKMFDDVTYECIPECFPNLKKKIKEIYSNPKIPRGSMVIHRGTGSGVETNRSVLGHVLKPKENKYKTNRYNNIDRDIPGPLGVIPDKTLIENLFLRELITKLYNRGEYCGTLLYHGTGGLVFSNVSDDDKDILDFEFNEFYEKEKYKIQVINRILARSYQKSTSYIIGNGLKKSGYEIIKTSNLVDEDEILRHKFPAILTIELSYMGGNPIGPLGDKYNNYIPTIEANLAAAHNFFKTSRLLKSVIYDNIYLIDYEVSKEYEEKIKRK